MNVLDSVTFFRFTPDIEKLISYALWYSDEALLITMWQL